jgi:hypothetical protein
VYDRNFEACAVGRIVADNRQQPSCDRERQDGQQFGFVSEVEVLVRAERDSTGGPAKVWVDNVQFGPVE